MHLQGTKLHKMQCAPSTCCRQPTPSSRLFRVDWKVSTYPVLPRCHQMAHHHWHCHHQPSPRPCSPSSCRASRPTDPTPLISGLVVTPTGADVGARARGCGGRAGIGVGVAMRARAGAEAGTRACGLYACRWAARAAAFSWEHGRLRVHGCAWVRARLEKCAGAWQGWGVRLWTGRCYYDQTSAELQHWLRGTRRGAVCAQRVDVRVHVLVRGGVIRMPNAYAHASAQGGQQGIKLIQW